MAGITATGSGATRTIMFEDDAAAPGGKGYYDIADFAAAFGSDIVPLGTTPQSYRCICHIQNGDGVGSATTTWDERLKPHIRFDTGFYYKVSATGRANRWTKWGTISAGADPVGYNGPTVYFGASTSLLGGNFELGGCDLRCHSGSMFLFPNIAGYTGKIVDCFMQADTNTWGVGNAAGGIAVIRRLTAGSLTSRAVQFNAEDVQGLTVFAPASTYKMQTGAQVIAADMRFAGPSSVADIRVNQPVSLLNPRWSKGVPKSDLSTVCEYVEVIGTVRDKDGNRVAGCKVEMYDRFGRKVVDVVTDADGELPAFQVAAAPYTGLLPPFYNAVQVIGLDIATGSFLSYHGPFVVVLNSDGAVAGHAVQQFTVAPQYDEWTGNGNTPTEFGGMDREFRRLGFNGNLRALVGPTAAFDVSPGGGAPGVDVQFTDMSDAGDAAISAWDWDFGDGSPHGTTQNPTHVYAVAGPYDVTLTVTTSVGVDAHTVTAAVVVAAPATPPPDPTDDVPYLHEQDITTMLNDIGQDVSLGGTTVKGLLNRVTEPILDGETGAPILATNISVSIRSGTLPLLAVGALLSVDGESYRVRQFMQVGEGAVTRIYLGTAT